MKKQEVTGMICSALSAVFYGTMSIMTKSAYALGSNPFMVVFGRFSTAALFAGLIILLAPSLSFRIEKRHALQLIPLSLFFCVTPLLLFGSYQYIDTSLGISLHFTYPVVVMILGAVLFHERPGRKDLLCGVLCMAGVFLLCRPQGNASALGLTIALISGVTYSCYIVGLGKSAVQELRVMTVTFWLSLFSAAEMLCFAAVFGKADFALPAQVWFWYALLGFDAMILAATLFQIGVRLCGPVKASLFSTLEPATGVLVGLLVFHEVMDGRAVTGIVLILLAVLVLALPRRKKAERSI